MPRRGADARRKYATRERDADEEGDDDNSSREGHGRREAARSMLPQLVPTKQRPPRHASDAVPMATTAPHWIETQRKLNKKATHVAVQAHQMRPNKTKPKTTKPHALSLLDEQMLVLCRSVLERSWGTNLAEEATVPRQKPLVERPQDVHQRYNLESIYAAIQVQRLFRGFKTRTRLAQFDGPRFQRAAGQIQFALRRVLVARRVFKRWMGTQHRCGTRIQAWYRGCRCRDHVQYVRARRLVARIIMFQRRFRGYRFWNLVATLLAQRRTKAATQIQRCYRGMSDRRCVRRIRQERIRFAMELRAMSDLHRGQARCKGCHPASWTEASLFACFMARYVGLHDFNGAKTLGQEGVQTFPESARFSFMLSILLQAMGEDLEISMAFLRRAELTLNIASVDILEMERRYFFPALQLCKNDIAVLLDLAIVSQCTAKLARAASLYRLALEQSPQDYSVPGYLHRVDMLDRLLLNYHRFCSMFNSKQINVLAKMVPIGKRGGQVRVMVSRHQHFTRIQCVDDDGLHRFNAVYLTDEEVRQLLASKVTTDDHDEGILLPSNPLSNIQPRKNSRHSARRSSRMAPRDEKNDNAKADDNAARKRVLTQIYQSEFRGLAVKPTALSGMSETRSKLQIARDQAEKLLRELIFVDPHAELKIELSDLGGKTSSAAAASLYRVLLVPSVLKRRMIRMEEVHCSHGAVNIQRLFRGFRVRARMRRELLLRSIRQQQVDQLYVRLHQNFQFREKRRFAAIAVQRMYKGFATRQLLSKWRTAAVTIQRIHRGFRGRKRAVAFREGNLTFYMAERVYQRGASISGKSVVLIIDRCGLSFRLEAYDMMGCTVYPGFISHDSSMAFIRYENWCYALKLIGYDVWLHGAHAVITAVAFINQSDGQCTVKCRFDGSELADDRLVALVDCIQVINLRSIGKKGLDAEQLLLPLTAEDTGRIVSSIVGRLALVPAIPMTTKELRRKAPGSFILTALPPPKVHYIYAKTDSIEIEISQTEARTQAKLPVSLARQIAFPVVDGYRGVSVGKRLFRQRCGRHSTHFTKCRCVLPLTTTPAYVQAITLALTPPLPSYHTTLADD